LHPDSLCTHMHALFTGNSHYMAIYRTHDAVYIQVRIHRIGYIVYYTGLDTQVRIHNTGT
jgi:hypothetical protein